MKIETVYLKKLRNEAHYEFFHEVIALTNTFPEVKIKLGTLFEKLNILFAREDAAVDYIRKSDYSAQIAQADRRLDGAVVGFGDYVRGSIHHFNPAVVAAAQSLKNLLDTYGAIIRKNYDEELAAVFNLLQDLSGAYAGKVTEIAGLSAWTGEMQAAANAMNALLRERTIETADKPHERMVDVRREIDPAYHEVVTRVESLANVEGEAGYAEFVSRLNVLIDRFNKHIHHPKTAEKPEN